MTVCILFFYQKAQQALEDEFNTFSEENPDFFEKQKRIEFSRMISDRKDSYLSEAMKTLNKS